MSAPAVSVLMAAYNAERYLRPAVESILNQTFRDFEFLIIDDGSADGTAAILQEYAKADGRIRIMHHQNSGPAIARNQGLAIAGGRYVAIMDADDVAFPVRLERQVATFERSPGLGLLGGAMIFIDQAGREVGRGGHPQNSADLKAALVRGNCFAHPTVMFPRNVVAEVGVYRPCFLQSEDYDLCLRIAERYEVGNLAEPLVCYRLHPSQVSTTHVRQEAVSVLAAQCAARLRQAGAPDPLDGVAKITPELLQELGVAPETIGTESVHYCLALAKRMLKCGYLQAAEQALHEARGCLQEHQLGRKPRAEVYMGLSRICRKQGKYLQSARWAAAGGLGLFR
jgi:hypothetical protein